MEYVKINSLWKREGWYFDQDKKASKDYQKGRQSFIVGDYASLEFGNVKHWSVEEKVDGTNIRIVYSGGIVRIGGRTNNAQIPSALLSVLQDLFPVDKLSSAFPPNDDGSFPNVVLYGEGYGPRIQACGHNYRGDPGFILFDVWVGGWWLMREGVGEVAAMLGIPMVPQIGVMTEEEIVDYVKGQPLSLCSRMKQVMEGVVCRTEPLTLYRSGKPLIFKLKCKEFVN